MIDKQQICLTKIYGNKYLRFLPAVPYSCSFFEVGKHQQQLRRGVKCLPYRVWPLITNYEAKSAKEPWHIWSSDEAKTHLPSYVSSIKRIGMHSLDTVDDGASLQCALYPNTISNSFIWFSVHYCCFCSYMDNYSRYSSYIISYNRL